MGAFVWTALFNTVSAIALMGSAWNKAAAIKKTNLANNLWLVQKNLTLARN
jgi:hypothetical protein